MIDDELELHPGSIIELNYMKFMVMQHEWIINEKRALVPFGYTVIPYNETWTSPFSVSVIRLEDMKYAKIVRKVWAESINGSLINS